MMFDFLRLEIFDLVFVITAVLFNWCIVGVFIAYKRDRLKLVRSIGSFMLSLVLPLSVVFVNYLIVGRPLWIMVYFGFIFFYILVEWLLDYVLKIDFRTRLITHIPYIILEYIALFGFIGIAFAINQTWGYIVSVSFWMVLGSLIYLYAGKKKNQEIT
jgi:hypothetical protein